MPTILTGLTDKQLWDRAEVFKRKRHFSRDEAEEARRIVNEIRRRQNEEEITKEDWFKEVGL